MRSLISTAIITACVVGISPSALAAPHMGAHQMQTSIHNSGAPRGHEIGHRQEGRHRHGISVPFDYFDPGLGTDEIGVPPADSTVDAPLLALPSPAVDLPPCRETAAGGVLVLRGTGCTPDKG